MLFKIRLRILSLSIDINNKRYSSVSKEDVPNVWNEYSVRILDNIGLTIVVSTETNSRLTSSLFSPAIISPSKSDTIKASTFVNLSKKVLNN